MHSVSEAELLDPIVSMPVHLEEIYYKMQLFVETYMHMESLNFGQMPNFPVSTRLRRS